MIERNREFKISFVGDIMCEKPLQRYAEKNGFDSFEEVFMHTKTLFLESDYVVGNLETVFAGAEAGYTNEMYRFNTPDEFAEALAKSGIHLVTTATNHSLDRGIDGLLRTINVLDKNGIAHVGTYTSTSEERILVKEFGDLKVAFLNYTYGTNVHETKVVLKEEELFHLNLLKPQTYNCQTFVGIDQVSPLRVAVSQLISKVFNTEQKMRLKKVLHRPYNFVRIDHLDEKEMAPEYLEQVKKDVETAKTQADVIIVCIHSGGQFNAEPGRFTDYIVDQLSAYGASAVVGTHPHVVQKAQFHQGVFTAFSLGNYSISPSSVYLLPENKPEYSIALHLYVGKHGVRRIGFSILKIVEKAGGLLSVYPVDELADTLGDAEKARLNEDVTFIYNRFTQKKEKCVPISREYSLSI